MQLVSAANTLPQHKIRHSPPAYTSLWLKLPLSSTLASLYSNWGASGLINTFLTKNLKGDRPSPCVFHCKEQLFQYASLQLGPLRVPGVPSQNHTRRCGA